MSPRIRHRPDGEPTVDELADRINRYGFDAAEGDVEHYARRLAARGEAPLLTSIMLDRGAPAIVRERAFARSALLLSGSAWPLVHVA